jgi:hypothetical protein
MVAQQPVGHKNLKTPQPLEINELKPNINIQVGCAAEKLRTKSFVFRSCMVAQQPA